jgi:tryptophan synthase beta chain
LTQTSEPLLPDPKGFFGDFGGCFAPEILMPNLLKLDQVFQEIVGDGNFWKAYQTELAEYCGRPTPLTHAKNLSQHLGGAQIFLKREDLNHTGAHKALNVIGQGLLVKKLNKNRVVAETGAGQHGVATATMAARFGLDCVVYMGEEDVKRQRPNVFWMEKLGTEVCVVKSGAKTLKDAINAALRDWSAHLDDTHYVLGTACGPHPFPALVAYFTRVIGLESKAQCEKQSVIPKKVFAAVGGGSNALGIFQGFLENGGPELVGVEAGGHSQKLGDHASRLSGDGTVGIAQGYKTVFLQTKSGQMAKTHSVAAGLDYVGVSPILAHWHSQGRIRMERAKDRDVMKATKLLMEKEGIIPALESAHALAQAFREAPMMSKDDCCIVNLSGRGDKDIFNYARVESDESFKEFLREQIKS